MASPGCRVSDRHPLCCRSMGLSSSTAQFSTWPRASLTFTYTCTCGFAQSTSVTMPVSVVGLVSSNLAEMAWWAAPRSMATPMSAATTASAQRSLCIAMPSRLLLTVDLELAGAAWALPSARDAAVVHGQVLDLPVDDVGDDGARLVLAVGLEVHHPAIGIERGVLHHHVVGAGVDGAGNRLAVPREDEQHVVAVHGVAGPCPDPRPLQWMP